MTNDSALPPPIPPPSGDICFRCAAPITSKDLVCARCKTPFERDAKTNEGCTAMHGDARFFWRRSLA